MKTLTWLLVSACVGTWGVVLGMLSPQVVEDPLMGYNEVRCDDIIRGHDGILRCEVTLQQEDDDIRIYRGDTSVKEKE
jgi:hypothetical protein